MRLERRGTVADYAQVELWVGWRKSKVLVYRMTPDGRYLLNLYFPVPKAKGLPLWRELMLVNRRSVEGRTGRFATWSQVVVQRRRKRPESTI